MDAAALITTPAEAEEEWEEQEVEEEELQDAAFNDSGCSFK